MNSNNMIRIKLNFINNNDIIITNMFKIMISKWLTKITSII